MFTGIVTGMGRVVSREQHGADCRLTVEAPAALLLDAHKGESMCVSGACLTMLDVGATTFAADVSAETLDRTTLGGLEPGRMVNLEPALRASDRLGGHLVSGHVDGRASLVERKAAGNSERFTFAAPRELSRYIAPKGSVCLDGISLTVNQVDGHHFGVCIIPHTLEVTTLGSLGEGGQVNIEVDMIARYLERLVPENGARA